MSGPLAERDVSTGVTLAGRAGAPLSASCSVLDRDGDASAAAVGMPSPSLSSRPLDDETSPVADGLVSSSSGPAQPSEVLAGWGSAGAAPEHIDGQLVLTGAEFRRSAR